VTSGNITWWGWTPQPASATAYIAEFNKKYPNIHITYKELVATDYDAALRPALASQNGPDLFGINPGARMTQYSAYALDMAPAMKAALGSDWKTKIDSAGPAGFTASNGKFAAIPVGGTYAGSLWINQDLFKKYSVQPPKTLDEWVKVCKTFKDNGVTCFVQGVATAGFDRDQLQSISNGIKPGVFSKAEQGKVKWTDPTIVKALTVWKSMFSNGIMQPGALGQQQFPDVQNKFYSGQAAMVMMGTWDMQYAANLNLLPAMSAAGVANPKPFSIIPIPYPSITGGPAEKYSLYGDTDYGLAVNAKSKSAGAATTFATWLGTSKDGQQLVANVLNDTPSLRGIKPDWASIQMPDKAAQQPAVQQLIDATSTATEPRLGLISTDVIQALSVAATTVAAGQATPQQAAATLQQAAEASGVVFK
jgi:raffinose/stachyose/melibiose transport system substrate-binding protein